MAPNMDRQPHITIMDADMDRQARIAKLQHYSFGLLPAEPEPDPTPYRAWINQPSTQQPLHKLHGTRILAVPESDGQICAYFLEGSTISISIGSDTISKGWPTTSHSTYPTIL